MRPEAVIQRLGKARPLRVAAIFQAQRQRRDSEAGEAIRMASELVEALSLPRWQRSRYCDPDGGIRVKYLQAGRRS
ncbi:hypothetical protein AAP84_25795, partial [Salmonella enterica subsp. enterica]|nr:hypothetical protein [Salmonella enterica subsp. enterica serovar Litchfield]